MVLYATQEISLYTGDTSKDYPVRVGARFSKRKRPPQRSVRGRAVSVGARGKIVEKIIVGYVGVGGDPNYDL